MPFYFTKNNRQTTKSKKAIIATTPKSFFYNLILCLSCGSVAKQIAKLFSKLFARAEGKRGEEKIKAALKLYQLGKAR